MSGSRMHQRGALVLLLLFCAGAAADTCLPGWSGASCDVCAVGYYGSTCVACPSCGPGGSCNDGLAGDGVCVCRPQWQLADGSCDKCVSSMTGPTCSECVDPAYDPDTLCVKTINPDPVIIGCVIAGVVFMFVLILLGTYLMGRRPTRSHAKNEFAPSTRMTLSLRRHVPAKLPPGTSPSTEPLNRAKTAMDLEKGISGLRDPPAAVQLQSTAALVMDEETADHQLSRAGFALGELNDKVIKGRFPDAKVAVRTYGADHTVERFMVEASIMWTLDSHRNVARMAACVPSAPFTLILPRYMGELHSWLHHSGDTEGPLEPHVIGSIAMGVLSGVSAVHALRVAHLDIQSSNILLEMPKDGGNVPTPLIANFAYAATDKLAGPVAVRAVRYAAPELFTYASAGATPSLEAAVAIDVYAVGCILWEVSERAIPWGDTPDEDIEAKVKGGAVLPPLQERSGGANARVRSCVEAAIKGTESSVPEERPSASGMLADMMYSFS